MQFFKEEISMGAKLVKFKLTPGENQQVEAIIKVPEERRSVIHGTVVDRFNKPVKDAVVKLLMLKDPNNPASICPITHTFTDEYGQFLFGPLCPNKAYILKVWFNDVTITPVVIHPDGCNDPCLVPDDKCTPKITDVEKEE